ncbi:hypothetical protein Dimus_027889 [Dionaea muscipula]
MVLVPISRLLRRACLCSLVRPNPPRILLGSPLCSAASAGQISYFSQTFHQTLAVSPFTLTYRLYSSTHRPFDFRNPCPIDFSEFKCQSNEKEESRAARLVESARKAKDLASKRGALRLLDDSGVEANDSLVCRAMWALRDDWELAMLVFKWGERQGCSGVRALGFVVWVLGSHQKFSVAWDLIRQSYRSAADTRTAMLIMIERYAAANYPQKAIKTFHLMENLRQSPDHNSFYTLLSALCNNGNVEDAEDIMLNNRKLFPLETEGFNIILYAWCNVTADVFEAKRVWREMSRYCITPNAVSYTLMISCFSKVRNLFDSLRLYDEMKRKGWVANIEVYNSLIYVLTSENCLDEALNVLKKIKEMGLRPDSTSYNSLICPLCEAGKFKEARELLDAMIRDGIHPTIHTYHAFLEIANVESSLELFNQMKKAGLGPDRESFLLLFDKFFRLKQPENALKIWVEMENYGVERESAHYTSLVQGLANCGCLVKARELHTEMASKPILQDPKLKRLIKERLRSSHLHRVICKAVFNHAIMEESSLECFHMILMSGLWSITDSGFDVIEVQKFSCSSQYLVQKEYLLPFELEKRCYELHEYVRHFKFNVPLEKMILVSWIQGLFSFRWLSVLQDLGALEMQTFESSDLYKVNVYQSRRYLHCEVSRWLQFL